MKAIEELKLQLPEALLSESYFMGEATFEIRKEYLVRVLTLLKPFYAVFTDLTGVDYLEPLKRTKVVYLLQDAATYQRIRITVFVERGKSLPSIVELWRGANWYERELYDLFGVVFDGHPDLKRLLMPDDWKGHPLQRDYALTEESVEFLHGVKPKIPSEIIPHAKKREKKT